MNQRKKKGLILRADDLEVGRYVTVLRWKDRRPFGLGHAVRITAIHLPYLVGLPVGEECQTVTLDIRDVYLMTVSEEYAKAQAGPSTTKKDDPLQEPTEELF